MKLGTARMVSLGYRSDAAFGIEARDSVYKAVETLDARPTTSVAWHSIHTAERRAPQSHVRNLERSFTQSPQVSGVSV